MPSLYMLVSLLTSSNHPLGPITDVYNSPASRRVNVKSVR